MCKLHKLLSWLKLSKQHLYTDENTHSNRKIVIEMTGIIVCY